MADIGIDPWSANDSTDYDALSDRFGLQKIDLSSIDKPSMLQRRNLVFAHRDLDVPLSAAERGDPFGVLTGLMPSGKMHLGHTMVIEQAKWFQELGADVTVAVADLESVATRGISLEQGRKVAMEEYVSNYAAMGLDPDKTRIYFQSSRPEVQRLAFVLGRRTNLSELGSIYGFGGDTNLAHVQAPLVQVGDILHPMLDEFGGLRPIVVPVGVDQDPHIRLTRDIVSKTQWFNIKNAKPAGILVSLSVQDENKTAFGIGENGRIDKIKRKDVISSVVRLLEDLGFADISPNPSHGTVVIPAATKSDEYRIRERLLELERSMGGLGLMSPASSYHKFAMGLTGGKMSSSKPETTIFLNDSIESMKKKIRKAHSGGQPTVEEHRRLGGNADVDVAYQYLRFFFEQDDSELDQISSRYASGSILAGEMKQICIDRAEEWLSELAEKRTQWSDRLDEYLS